MVIKRLTSFYAALKSRRRKSDHGRTFIFPTRFGFYYALGIFLIAAVAYVYGNNLVYMLAFFLTSLGFITMHVTNRNIDHLRVKVLPIKEIFANEKTNAEVFFQDKKNKLSHFVSCSFSKSFWTSKKVLTEILNECSDQGQAISVPLVIPNRGWQEMTPLRVSSSFPFGLLLSWKIIHASKDKILVYPEKKGSRILPVRSYLRGQEYVGQMKEKTSDNSFQGHRPYQNRDSFRQIDWRAYARSGELLIKEFESEQKGILVLDWEDTSHLGHIESRISQLALWVEICEKENKFYCLRLPSWQSEMNSGEQHKTACLSQLATLELPA